MPPDPSDPAVLLDLLPVSVARVGPDLRLRSANARLCHLLGRPPGEVVGHLCSDWATPEAWGDWSAAVRSVFATGRPADVQYLAELPDGERLVHTKCVPVPGPDGGVAEVLAVAYVTDEVRQLREALSRSEQRFQAFMDHLPAAAWLRDADERYLFLNREYRRVRGLAPGEQIGKRPDEVYPPEVAARMLANDRHLLAAGRPVRVEEQAPDADGAMRTWLNIKFTVPGPDGRPQFAGVGLDVTEERRREDERRAMEAKVLVAQKAEALGVLAGGVAHDFNNILAAVLGFAGLGKEMVRDNPPARDCFAQIEAAADRAADLCRQMLAYAGDGKGGDRPVDLSAAVRETVRLLAAGHLRGVAVTLDLADPLPPVVGDPTQLRQVVLNLLTNAAEATAGGPTRAVTVATGTTADTSGTPLPAGEYVRLAVADTGTGMDPATAARVFEPFFTTKFTGRGLGLAAVAGIVRGHRGAVRLSTAPGAGSTFEVLLPAAPAA